MNLMKLIRWCDRCGRNPIMQVVESAPRFFFHPTFTNATVTSPCVLHHVANFSCHFCVFSYGRAVLSHGVQISASCAHDPFSETSTHTWIKIKERTKGGAERASPQKSHPQSNGTLTFGIFMWTCPSCLTS